MRKTWLDEEGHMSTDDRLKKLEETVAKLVELLSPRLPDYTIDDIAERIATRHPRKPSMSPAWVGQLLMPLVENAVNPRASAEAIDKLHAWMCKYDFSQRPMLMVPKLDKWLKEDSAAICPTEAEGEAMLASSRPTSKADKLFSDMDSIYGN